MTPPLSKPLLTALLLTAVASILSVLAPEAPVASAEAELLAPPRRAPAPALPADASEPVALRRVLQPPPALSNHGYAPPPPPPPVTAPPPVVKPTAPAPPYVYIGRMVRDGEVVVFLGRGENVEAVALGHDIDGTWRLEDISERSLRLRYLPLDETRLLITSN